MDSPVEIDNLRALELAKSVMGVLISSTPTPTRGEVEDALAVATVLCKSTPFPVWRQAQ